MNLVILKFTKLIHISLLHSYILTIEYQKEKSNKLSYLVLHKKIKYLEIHLSKEAKDLYSENYKV